jgi:hypothetical protein
MKVRAFVGCRDEVAIDPQAVTAMLLRLAEALR